MSLSVIKYNLNSDYLISEYVSDVSMMNKLTAREYHARLRIFKKLVEDKYSFGFSGVDFKNQILIKNVFVKNNSGMINCIFLKEGERKLQIYFHLFQSLCLAWVVA